MVTQKTEVLHGNQRIQQLMEEFPEIPRSLVVKADAVREGVKPSVGARLAGRWALPYAPWYFDYSKEDTSIAAETTEGYILSPVICHFNNGVGLMPMWDSKSPYEIRYEEKGRYRLYRDGDPIEEVSFSARPPWYDKKTSSGKPMPSVISQKAEDNMMVVPLTYCEYFKDNAGCRYCNINPNESTKKGLGMERITAKREQDVYETMLAAAPEVSPRTSITMSGGVILDSSKEAEAYIRLIKAQRRAMKDVGIEFPIGVKCQALAAEDQIKVKEAGASSMGFNLEIWDPKLFEIMCPGKAKYVGRERWIERLLQAKEIWGRTNTSMILGLEMAPPYGFKTEEEAGESVLEGWEWLMAHGIAPGATQWRCVPGTEFAGLPAPRTEYFLRMSLAHYKLSVKHNMAPKRTRPIGNGQSIFYDFPQVDLPVPPAAAPSRGATPSGDIC